MNGLLDNQGFDTALIALIVALTAFVQQRVSQAKQGAQLDAVQQQQAKQGSAVLVTPVTPVTVRGGAQTEEEGQVATGPLVAASVQCPHCAQQVHLDSLIPAPAGPADGPPAGSAPAGP